MARLRYYARSLISGYVLLAANVAYTLGSVPLALRYLSTEEFALWAMTSQLVGYIALLDLGMGGAVMRVLIDFKDRRSETVYGSTILTGILVNLAQGLLVIVSGVGLAFLLGPLLRIPEGLSSRFLWLLIGQAALTGGGLALRMASLILAAHQRSDLVNWSQALLFGLGFIVLWWGFASGEGVFSMLWGSVVGQVIGPIVAIIACVRLKLLPQGNLWGRPGWDRFRELFAFGKDMLLYSLGNQLVNASQTILIARMVDLPTAAAWSVCTRVFTLLTQAAFKIFDSACSPFAEMIVRGERQRLLVRFRSMTVLSGSLSVIGGVGLAVCNQPFVEWWTSGRISWPVWNDWLLAFWLPILVSVRSHTGLVGLTKEFRFLRYLYFLEGFFFVGIALLVLRHGGITAMLGISILGSLLFSFSYSIRRTSKFFAVSCREVAWGWMRPTFQLAVMLVPVGAFAGWFSQSLDPLTRLMACGVVICGVGGLLLLQIGLDELTREEIRNRTPKQLAWLHRLYGSRRGNAS